MNKVIVLITRGKQDDVDSVSVYLFDNDVDANNCLNCINANNDKDTKYWSYAQIIQETNIVPLCNEYRQG